MLNKTFKLKFCNYITGYVMYLTQVYVCVYVRMCYILVYITYLFNNTGDILY